jgi:HK97 family phage major capsid protein
MKCKHCGKTETDCTCTALEKQVAEGFEKIGATIKQTAEELSAQIAEVDGKVTANTEAIEANSERITALEGAASADADTDDDDKSTDEGEKNKKAAGRKAGPVIFAPTKRDDISEAKAARMNTCKRLAHTVTKGNFCKFLKAAKLNDLTTLKALSGQTDAAGGHLVPQEHRDALLEIIEEYGWIRRQSMVIPMGSDEMDMPKSLTETTAAWVAESDTAPDGDPSFANKQLLAKEARSKVIVPNALLADSVPAIDTILLDQFGRAYAKLEDDAGFNGQGSGASDPHTGILVDSDTTSVAAVGTTLTYDDLVELEEALTGGARKGAWLYVSRKGFSHLRKVKDAQGRPLWTDNIQDGTLGMVLGYPVAVVESGIPDNLGAGLDETRFILGNLQHVAFGDRERFEVRVSEHVRFEAAQTVFMGTERVGITVANPEGFAILAGIIA